MLQKGWNLKNISIVDECSIRVDYHRMEKIKKGKLTIKAKLYTIENKKVNVTNETKDSTLEEIHFFLSTIIRNKNVLEY